nr:MAG TPA: hypothetical protein [Caudoviricetes sp.]
MSIKVSLVFTYFLGIAGLFNTVGEKFHYIAYNI